MEETKQVTIQVKDEFHCEIDCQYLRRYDSARDGTWWCTLYSSKLPFIHETHQVHRDSKCDGTYLFTMKSVEGKPPEFTE